MRALTTVFKALSDETRLKMIGLLLEQGEGELCVCDFVHALAITQSKASRHLRHLVHAGLLCDRRDAIWVYFRIANDPGPAQARVIEMLPAVLEGRVPAELLERLADWKRSKECAGGSCG
ncbi:MAG: metalloregulator ArsR/SmtB family transcription factor [Deltaproteobacteria bacterium]|nr:metalloregulator ArsR/SmtB family transcription factor [Deltaproteobacteria bacterium]